MCTGGMRVFSLSLARSLERVLGLYLLLVYTCAEGGMWGFSFSLARSLLARSRSLFLVPHVHGGHLVAQVGALCWLHKWGLCAQPKSRLLPSLVAWVQSYKVYKLYKVYKVYQGVQGVQGVQGIQGVQGPILSDLLSRIRCVYPHL